MKSKQQFPIYTDNSIQSIMTKRQQYKAILLLVLLILSLFSSKLVLAKSDSIIGIVVDSETRERINDVNIELIKNGSSIKQKITGPDKPFSFEVILDENIDYQLVINKSGYKTHSIDISSAIKAKTIPTKLIISLGGDKNSFIFKGTVSNRKNTTALGNINIQATNIMTGETVTKVSDLNGKYAIKILSGYEYDIVISSHEYLKRFTTINYCKDELEKKNKFCFSGFNNVSLNTDGAVSGATVLMDKIVIGKKFKVDNIYYDYNKDTLRKDALPSLRKVLYILDDNKQITIELGSHADSRGSDEYNLNLSQRRAESAVDYIIKEGTAKERIKAKGYGETMLLNECANNIKCSDKKHGKNRRTEFTIIDILDPLE